MIVRPELITKIKDYFDLNIYETKVWLALLSKGVASAGDIAKISKVPRSRTYDVLENLEKKGFAMAKIGKPIKYMGVKPKVILERLKRGVRNDAEEKINYLSNLKNTEEFTKLEDLYKKGSSPMKRDDLSLSLTGRTAISNHTKEILNKAKKEVIICDSAEDIASKLKLFAKTISLLRSSGIEVKIALSGEDELIKKISNTLGIKIRKINVNTKLFIIDKHEVLFYLSKDDEEENAIWISSEFFTKAFADLVELCLKSKAE
jgi:sugar-specific transcriptional regulator TrmB